MSVEIDIGGPVADPRFESMWEVEVSYMHGDANGYSSETMYYDDQNEMILTLEGLAFMKKLPLGQQQIDDNKERIEAFFAEMGGSEEEATNFTEDFHQLDTTDESYDNDAQIESIFVFWYDENGIKFHTTPSVNGNVLK